MLKPDEFNFCPACGEAMVNGREAARECSASGCDFMFWNNPTPVVAAIVETSAGVILAHNVAWPAGMMGLITGFLESGESAEVGVLREVKEELNLDATEANYVGTYEFRRMNQIIIAYHVPADGPITLNEELDDYRAVPPAKLRPWPFGTGDAVRDWMLSKGLKPVPMEWPPA